MSAEQIQDSIIRRLIQLSPVELKTDRPIRQSTNGPDLAFYQVACLDCQRRMKANWIQIRFVQGQEEKWESDAQARVIQHLDQFHEGQLNVR